MKLLSQGAFQLFPFCPSQEALRSKFLTPYIQNYSLQLIQQSVFDNHTMVSLLIQCQQFSFLFSHCPIRRDCPPHQIADYFQQIMQICLTKDVPLSFEIVKPMIQLLKYKNMPEAIEKLIRFLRERKSIIPRELGFYIETCKEHMLIDLVISLYTEEQEDFVSPILFIIEQPAHQQRVMSYLESVITSPQTPQYEATIKSIVNWMFYSKSLLTLLHINFQHTFRLCSLLMTDRVQEAIAHAPNSIGIQIEDYSLIHDYEQHLVQYSHPRNRIILMLLQCSYQMSPSQTQVIMHFLYD